MGLDVYVGPLCRYYAGDWKTIIRQTSETIGVEYRQIVQNPRPADAITEATEALKVIQVWRKFIADRFRGQIVGNLDWPELPDGPYETDKPDFDGLIAIHIAALSTEFPDLMPPLTVREYSDDQRNPYRQVVDERYAPTPPKRSLFGRGKPEADHGPVPTFPNLVLAEMWLPVDITGLIDASDPAGNRVTIGSVPALLAELELVNERMFRMSAAQEEAARQRGLPPSDSPAMDIAPVGLAILLRLARIAVERRQPIRLDY